MSCGYSRQTWTTLPETKKDHERAWLDSVLVMVHLKNSNPKDKMNSIGCTMMLNWTSIRTLKNFPGRARSQTSMLRFHDVSRLWLDGSCTVTSGSSIVMEAADELWLLQTDLACFRDLKKRHEREWLDSIPLMQEQKSVQSKGEDTQHL